MPNHSTQEYCCAFIEDITKRLPWEEGYSMAIPIKYSPSRRLYLLQLCPRYLHNGGSVQHHHFLKGIPINYCPHCGTALPKELTAVRSKILKKEYDIDLQSDADAIVPEEFFSDIWWKQRGLY